MSAQDQANIANIQRPFLEYRAIFNDPITSFWYGARHGEVIGSMMKALSPWQLSLENISWNQAPKNLAEAQVTFTLPALFASIQLSMAGINASAINPDWSRVKQFVSLFQTGVDTLKAVVAQELKSQHTTLGFHVTPNVRPFREIMSRFINTKELHAEDASMFGLSAYYGDFSFVIDGSAVFPESVFIKLSRAYSPATRFEEMAGTIYKDEENVLQLLDLKLQ